MKDAVGTVVFAQRAASADVPQVLWHYSRGL